MRTVRFIVIAMVLCAFCLVAVADDKSQTAQKATDQTATKKATIKQSFCPPCGMKIDPKTSPSVEVEGCKVYVCSDYCGEKVKKDPATYLKKIKDAGETPETVPAKTATTKASATATAKSSACGKCPMKDGCAKSDAGSGAEKK